MKKAALLIGLALALGLSSCYRHSVCATYVSNDAPTEQNTDSEDNL